MTRIGRAEPFGTAAAGSTAITDALAVARRHVEEGKIVEAEAIFRQLVARYASNAAVLLRLGDAAASFGQAKAAAHFFRCALTLRPDLAEAHAGLGATLLALREYAAAIVSSRRAITLKPRLFVAHLSLGAALFNSGGDLRQAEVAMRRAIALKPSSVIARCTLGNILLQLGERASAAASYRHALKIDPTHVEAQCNLALALDRHDEAIEKISAVVATSPNAVMWRLSLGKLLAEHGQLAEAAGQYRLALEVEPSSAIVRNNLGYSCLARGLPEEAIEHFRAPLKRAPHLQNVWSNLLYSLNFAGQMPPKDVFAEHRDWGRKVQAGRARRAFRNVPDPDRVLRVGYVSPDFRMHSCAFFIEPLLAAHDRHAIELFAYSDVPSPDAMTERLRQHAGLWRNVVGLTDAALVALIVEDRIDILVDLAGHTRGNRLGVFAEKPAPLQVSWLGYPNTTGLAAIDYRLTDPIADPPGSDQHAVERLLRLPRGFLCYRPPAAAPDVAPVPSQSTGHVTFGSFNTLSKISAEAIALWSSILAQVPGARLFLKAEALADAATADELRHRLAAAGIARERVTAAGWHRELRAHFANYDALDIALDTMPYNGTTTTLEALWMGVPVIVLRGDRHASRVGASILEQAGLGELVAETPMQYVERAVALAADASRLAALRAGMRARLASSPLRDEVGFARAVEAAYRTMWREWCATTEARQRGR